MNGLSIRIDRDRVVVERHRGTELAWSAESPITSSADLEAALTGLPALDGWEHVRRADVVLAPDLVQRRLLRDIPPVRQAALCEMVALQQGRFFRHFGVPLATSARWLSADRKAGAQAIAADSNCLDAIARGLENSGVRTVRIRAPVDGMELQAPYLLSGWKRRRRVLNRAFICLAVLGWCGAPIVHMARLMRADRRLSSELADLAAPAEALRTAHRDLAAAALIVNQVDASLGERRKLLGLVGAIMTTVPDSAFVSALSLPAAGEGVMTGTAQEPALITSHLERIKSVVSPRLDGASTAESGPGRWETYSIRFERRRP